jgi:hypothetical protein
MQADDRDKDDESDIHQQALRGSGIAPNTG